MIEWMDDSRKKNEVVTPSTEDLSTLAQRPSSKGSCMKIVNVTMSNNWDVLQVQVQEQTRIWVVLE